MSATGALFGLLAAAGIGLFVRGLPIRRRPSLADRVVPYLPELTLGEHLSPWQQARVRPGAGLRLVRHTFEDVARRADRVVGRRSLVQQRLDALGVSTSVEEFRQQQVLSALIGGGSGLALLSIRLGSGIGPPPISLAGLVVVGTIAAFLGRDALLSRAVRQREMRMALELPAVAELLALAVGSGESPVAALERVTRGARGALSTELARAVADARAGATFVQALGAVATRTSLPALGRFVDGIAIALQRGTPLADVLRAQALDVREEARRKLLETGGKKEIAMMVPVVFLVLPVTILFALFPGVVTLTTMSR